MSARSITSCWPMMTLPVFVPRLGENFFQFFRVHPQTHGARAGRVEAERAGKNFPLTCLADRDVFKPSGVPVHSTEHQTDHSFLFSAAQALATTMPTGISTQPCPADGKPHRARRRKNKKKMKALTSYLLNQATPLWVCKSELMSLRCEQ